MLLFRLLPRPGRPPPALAAAAEDEEGAAAEGDEPEDEDGGGGGGGGAVVALWRPGLDARRPPGARRFLAPSPSAQPASFRGACSRRLALPSQDSLRETLRAGPGHRVRGLRP